MHEYLHTPHFIVGQLDKGSILTRATVPLKKYVNAKMSIFLLR